MDGTGSFGAAIGQLAAGQISQNLSWTAAFLFLAIISVVSVVCISPIFVKDVKAVRRKWRHRNGTRQHSESQDDDSETSILRGHSMSFS